MSEAIIIALISLLGGILGAYIPIIPKTRGRLGPAIIGGVIGLVVGIVSMSILGGIRNPPPGSTQATAPTGSTPQATEQEATRAPTAGTTACTERQFDWPDSKPFREIILDTPPGSLAYHNISLWWEGQLPIAESNAIRRVSSPNNPVATEITFVMPPSITEIRFRNSPGGKAWRICGQTLDAVQQAANTHSDGLVTTQPTTQHWRINLPQGLSDPEIQKLISCITPGMKGIQECSSKT